MHPLAHGMRDLICRCEPTPIFEPPNYVVEGSLETGDASDDTEGDAACFRAPTERYPGSRPAVRPGEEDFRLAALTFSVRREATQEHFVGFIAISELFKDAQKWNAAFVDSEGGILDDGYRSRRLLRWEEWGPKWTRFLPGAVSRAWVCYIYKTRFVFITLEPPLLIDEDDEPTDLDGNGGYLGVLDFNPHGLHESYPARNGAWLSSSEGLKYAPSGDPQETSTRHIYKAFDHTQPIPVGNDLFASPIVSHLSFRRFSSCQRINGEGEVFPMIDAERILLVEVRNIVRTSGSE